MRYLDGGFATLVRALESTARAAGAGIETSWRADEVVPTGSGFEVRGPSGVLGAATVVLAAGGPTAAAGLSGAVREALDAAPALGPDATAACLDLGLRRQPAVGFVLGLDRPVYLSEHAPPGDLAPPGMASVQLARYTATTGADDREELWALAASVGVERGDVATERFLAKMVVMHALPRPGAGLAGRPGVDVAGVAGLAVAGDWVGPTGMLADASLSSAEAAANLALAHLDRRSGRDLVA